MRLETHGSSSAHAIYVPTPSFTATCNGTALSAPRDPSTGLVELACDGVLAVAP